MKAIIPVAGMGAKLRPHTHTQPKPLMPVAGMPLLGHIVDSIAEAGVTHCIFVVGYMADKIQDYVNETYSGRLSYSFVLQEPRLGLAHAVGLCRHLVDPGEQVIIALGDTIIDTDLASFATADHSTLAVSRVDDPRRFGVAMTDTSGWITALVEKPAIPKSNLALVGLYKIVESGALFEAIDYLMANKITTRTEYHLTDALMRMVEQGVKMKASEVKNWYDCGKSTELLATNRLLLQRTNRQPTVLPPGVVINPPVYIPDSCVLENCIIGPNVALGESATVRNSVVSDAILGAWSTLDAIVLRGSIVGNDSTLVGGSYSVNIGDNAEIDLRSTL